MCSAGCSRGEVVKLQEALANPFAFVRCYGAHVKTPLKIAIGKKVVIKPKHCIENSWRRIRVFIRGKRRNSNNNSNRVVTDDNIVL